METATSGEAGGNVVVVPTHGAMYKQYNVFGNSFEVSAKYNPPFRLLGRGAYGVLCSAIDSETQDVVAIKKIGNAFQNNIDAKRTLREIKLLRHMDHENVISIKDIICPPNRDTFEDVYLVFEYMEMDLHQIVRSNQPLTENHRRSFLYQLLRGLKYLHSANVLHRDLKPGNLLLNSNCDLKICDFGLARISEGEDRRMTEYVVTRWYRAPELLLFCNDYTAAIDIWSVGCIFMEVLGGRPLFPGSNYVHQLKLIVELTGSPEESDLGFLRSENKARYVKNLGKYESQSLRRNHPDINADALDLIEKMLIFDPEKRITVNQALEHPYLATLHDSNDEPDCHETFDISFEQQPLTEEDIKDLIMKEALEFNPLPAADPMTE